MAGNNGYRTDGVVLGAAIKRVQCVWRTACDSRDVVVLDTDDAAFRAVFAALDGQAVEVERLRAALLDVRAFVEAELEVRFASATIGGDPATMDDAEAASVGEAMDCLARLKATLAQAPAASEQENGQ